MSSADAPVAVAGLSPRRRARVAGTVTALTYQPEDVHPALRARVEDGTGSLDLVFLGRRDVPGLVPGRRVLVEGMVAGVEQGRRAHTAMTGARPVIYNPAYRLLPSEGEA